MASLQALEDEVEAFCRDRAQALAEAGTGRTPRAELGAVERAHPLAVSPDTVAAVQAALSSSRTPEAHRPRLAALLPFVSRAALEAQARGADDALRNARGASEVTVGGTSLPLERAWAAVAEEPDAARRAVLSRAAAEAELQLLGAVECRWEALRSAAVALAIPPVPAPLALQAEAVDFLHRTEDAWRDVLGYACRRLRPELRPLPQGDAALHDLLRLMDTPLPGAFPAGERLPAVRRWLDASGLTLEAQGRLRLDAAKTLSLPQPACFAVEVPARVLLVLPPLGHGSFSALLDAVGRARAAASVSASASLGARRLGDAAVGASAGVLVRGVLSSAPWLRRFLGLGRTEAREVARLSALAHLGELRMLAARLPFASTLLHAGPSKARLEALASALSEALFLRIPEGALLPSLWEWPSAADTLRAHLLAESLQHQADERFDAEDFRNPSAAQWLASVWARGTELDADALAKQLGTPLSLSEVGRRLLAVLGA